MATCQRPLDARKLCHGCLKLYEEKILRQNKLHPIYSMKSTSKKAISPAVQADILRSAVASFGIEKIVITPQQATAAMQKIEATLGKSTR